ncbi:MAG: peptidoglycan editing factor PgeF [Syntrophales bacterium]|nr:peptidoglycan editing factor PgeF [Syntrophales bacterium]
MANRGGILVVEVSLLATVDWLVHGFCCRHGGVSRGPYSSLNTSAREGDTPENVARNRSLIADSFSLAPGNLVVLQQVHGDGIIVLDAPPRHGGQPPPIGDAAVTDCPDMALCIRTADCVPLFLVDPIRRVIANVHAGWRGTAQDMAGKVVETMISQFGSRPSQIMAAIGPAIGRCCYEVDMEVISAMGAWISGSVLVPATRPGHGKLDLQAVNRHQLQARGLLAEHITTIPLCTSCREDLFFSHRRDRQGTGRQANVLMIRKSLT